MDSSIAALDPFKNRNWFTYMAQSHVLAEGFTRQAINQYNIEKEKFLTAIEEAGYDNSDIIERLNNYLIQENQNPNSTLIKKAEEALKQVEDQFNNKVSPNSLNQVFPQEFIDNIKNYQPKKGAKREYLKNAYENVVRRVNEYIKSTKTVRDFFQNIKDLGGNNTALINQFVGYSRKLLFDSITNYTNGKGVNIQHFIESIKGYFGEDLGQDAINNLFQGSSFRAKNTGMFTDAEGKQTTMDIAIVIGKNASYTGKNQLTQLFNDKFAKWEKSETVTGTSTLLDERQIFGVQSKSWHAPFQEALKVYGRSSSYHLGMGNHSKVLTNALDNGKTYTRVYHEGLIIAAEHMAEIIGPNVLFQTGAGFSFTADLILNMRANGYRLAFYVGKDHKTTGTVEWQLHGDSN